MKNFTLTIIFTLLVVKAFSQAVCPSATVWIGSGLLAMNYPAGSPGETTTFAALGSTGSIALSGASNAGQNIGGIALTLTPADISVAADRLRPLNSATGNNCVPPATTGCNGVFTGTITITPATGAPLLCTYAAGALPIDLLTFQASNSTNGIDLKWSTATESGNDFMSVERSTDGRNFTEIGRVKGKGTTSETQNYRFEDAKPARGVNYYRLRQVDIDGTFDYSHAVVARFGNDKVASFVATPNVISTTDPIVLSFFDESNVEELVLDLYDMQGRLIYTHISATSGHTLIHDLQLTAGQYLIKVRNTGEYTRFFVKG
jgi:hypothetical protein